MEFLNIIASLVLCYMLIRAILSIFGVGKLKNLPPGPTGLPIIGNLLQLGDQPHQSLAKLAQIHGPIMSLHLGHVTTVVISSAAAAKEVLQKQDLAFSNRHVPDALNANHAKYAIGWLPICSEWRTLRRILNSNIFSTKSLEANQHLRYQKVEDLLAYCRKASVSSDYVDIGRAVFRTSLNLISNTIFSKDITDPYKEDLGTEFKVAIGNMLVEAGKPNVVDFFPVLKKIDPQGIRRRLTHHYGKLLDVFEDFIEERLAIGRFNQDDVLDVCLKFIRDNPDEINTKHMKSLFVDLFVGGTDTTSSTVEWAMAELLRNQHTMIKAKQELEEVIGQGKTVKDDDVSRLPYLSCIVKETLRLHPPGPLLVPRKVDRQVQLSGYTIPKGTQVLVNAWAIGRDPTSWEDPLEFKPQRFLASAIDVRGQDFELIPFGAGRRICPGLPLAIRMIPIMLGSLLNNFDWSLDAENQHEALNMTEKFGIGLSKATPLRVVPKPLN